MHGSSQSKKLKWIPSIFALAARLQSFVITVSFFNIKGI